jgi:hypothetical protein
VKRQRKTEEEERERESRRNLSICAIEVGGFSRLDEQPLVAQPQINQLLVLLGLRQLQRLRVRQRGLLLHAVRERAANKRDGIVARETAELRFADYLKDRARIKDDEK